MYLFEIYQQLGGREKNASGGQRLLQKNPAPKESQEMLSEIIKVTSQLGDLEQHFNLPDPRLLANKMKSLSFHALKSCALKDKMLC